MPILPDHIIQLRAVRNALVYSSKGRELINGEIIRCAAVVILFITGVMGCQSSPDKPTIESDFQSYMDSTRALVLESNYNDSLQNELASVYFDYYVKHRESKQGRDAIARAFLYWGNTGNTERVREALEQVQFDSLTFERVHSYLSNSFYRKDPPAKQQYLAVLESLQDRVTHPAGQSEILYKKGEYFLREDEPERAEQIFQRIIEMNADSGDVQAAKGSLYEIRNLQVGMQAPSFTARTLQGDPISLSDLRGKVVLLDFWATWCGPCLPYIPLLSNLYDKYPPDRFQLVGLAFNRSEEDVRTMMQEKNMSWPQVILTDRFRSEIAQKYNINSIPQTYILGENGNILAKNTPRNQLDNVLSDILDAQNRTSGTEE